MVERSPPLPDLPATGMLLHAKNLGCKQRGTKAIFNTLVEEAISSLAALIDRFPRYKLSNSADTRARFTSSFRAKQTPKLFSECGRTTKASRTKALRLAAEQTRTPTQLHEKMSAQIALANLASSGNAVFNRLNLINKGAVPGKNARRKALNAARVLQCAQRNTGSVTMTPKEPKKPKKESVSVSVSPVERKISTAFTSYFSDVIGFLTDQKERHNLAFVSLGADSDSASLKLGLTTEGKNCYGDPLLSTSELISISMGAGSKEDENTLLTPLALQFTGQTAKFLRDHFKKNGTSICDFRDPELEVNSKQLQTFPTRVTDSASLSPLDAEGVSVMWSFAFFYDFVSLYMENHLDLAVMHMGDMKWKNLLRNMSSCGHRFGCSICVLNVREDWKKFDPTTDFRTERVRETAAELTSGKAQKYAADMREKGTTVTSEDSILYVLDTKFHDKDASKIMMGVKGVPHSAVVPWNSNPSAFHTGLGICALIFRILFEWITNFGKIGAKAAEFHAVFERFHVKSHNTSGKTGASTIQFINARSGGQKKKKATNMNGTETKSAVKKEIAVHLLPLLLEKDVLKRVFPKDFHWKDRTPVEQESELKEQEVYMKIRVDTMQHWMVEVLDLCWEHHDFSPGTDALKRFELLINELKESWDVVTSDRRGPLCLHMILHCFDYAKRHKRLANDGESDLERLHQSVKRRAEKLFSSAQKGPRVRFGRASEFYADSQLHNEFKVTAKRKRKYSNTGGL